MGTNEEALASGVEEQQHTPDNRSEVNIIESENENSKAEVDPGRTPGKAEGVEDPEIAGNE